MAIRRGDEVDVTISVAVDPLAATTSATYNRLLAELKLELDRVAERTLAGRLRHRIALNSGDANPFRSKRHYLLGSGSCLEFGEEGFVGRGNTACGLIPVGRPKSVEAPFGKNPTYHSGKVYVLHAEQIARAVHRTCGAGVTVTIVARHSDPLRQPSFVHLALHGEADLREATDVALRQLAVTDHLALALGGSLVPR